ncbi:MAG TPA: response regulator [Verrucomicrobiae bacterium]
MKRPRVLVVEDEVIVAMDFEQRLKRLGYTVAGVAHDGRQAITKTAEGNPELILMDINLGGGMSGIESAVTIRQRHDVPVIYVTAYSDPDTVRRAAQSDPFGYILKPFEDRELETAIQVGMVKHEMEHRLRESEQRFNATLTSIADGLIATKADGRIAFFNPSAEKITGWIQPDALGRVLGEVFPLADDGTHGQGTDFFSSFTLPGMLPGSSRTASLRRRDGVQIPVEYRAAHIHNDNCQLTGVVISFSDIRGRREAEARILRTQEELKRAHDHLMHKHEELQKFYHTVSHELKTPLTSGREFVSLVLEGLGGPVTETQKDYLGIARESCDQMRTCINDMLDVTRLETGKMSIELNPGCVGELVTRVVSMLKPAASRRKIQLSCEVQPDVPHIPMDETRIAQVLTNLLNNALKFTPEGGRISVTVSCPPAQPGEVLISVADTGRGIPRENLNRIFDRLYQVRDADAASCKGLGLGLFICRELVSLHGGAIRVESEPGKGSTFFVTLPVAPRRRLRALVVDDEADIREGLQLMLEAENYSVTLAADGREALEQVRREKPDVVITDLVMPGRTGPELLKGIRHYCGSVPVLVYTGHPESDLLASTLKSPPVFFLRKPCDPARLLRTVRNAIKVAGHVFAN